MVAPQLAQRGSPYRGRVATTHEVGTDVTLRQVKNERLRLREEEKEDHEGDSRVTTTT